jgi:hypothetical protein
MQTVKHLQRLTGDNFIKILLTYVELHGILFFDKNENYFKANLLKSRDAKPEGTKVRKPDYVSRLPLFPYVEKM